MNNPLSSSYHRIWEIVCAIPKGKVSTYGAIAELAGKKKQARLVGYALHNIPSGFDVPWHRVVNAQGKISLPKNNGYEKQKMLLEKEGIIFAGERIDLEKFGWKKRRTHSK